MNRAGYTDPCQITLSVELTRITILVFFTWGRWGVGKTLYRAFSYSHWLSKDIWSFLIHTALLSALSHFPMALIANRLLCYTSTRTPYTQLPLRRPFFIPSSPSWSHQPRTSSSTVSANPKKLSSSSRTGRYDSKNRRSSVSTKEQQQEEVVVEKQGIDEISVDNNSATIAAVDDGFVMPDLPGEKPDFWEGPQWDVLGFFLQYMWAFGIVFAVIYV